MTRHQLANIQTVLERPPAVIAPLPYTSVNHELSLPSHVSAVGAAALYHACGNQPQIVISGEEYGPGSSTAERMRQVLLNSDVPDARIAVADHGNSTPPQVAGVQRWRRQNPPTADGEGIVFTGFGDHLAWRVGPLAERAGIESFRLVRVQDALSLDGQHAALLAGADAFDTNNRPYEASRARFNRLLLGSLGFRATVAIFNTLTRLLGQNSVDVRQTVDGYRYNQQLIRR